MNLIKNRKLLFFTTVASVAVILFGMTASVVAQSGNPEQRNPQTTIAEIYAKHYGVTIDEALHRLSLQDSFPDLEPQLEKNEAVTFGGLWIQHEPQYKIVVAFTRDGDTTIGKYRSYIPAAIAPYLELRTVNKSLAELRSDQRTFVQSLSEQAIKVLSRVDVTNNQVSIDISRSDKVTYDATVAEGKMKLPTKLTVNVVDGLALPQTDMWGGLTLQKFIGPLLYDHVTSGFAVHNNNTGVDGIATAGHADNVTLYFATWHYLPYQNEAFSGSCDVQWHSAPGLNVPNKIRWWSDGSTFDITSTKSRDQQSVGDVVSKYGMTTQYTAGVISSKDISLPYVQNSASTFIEVNNVYGYSKLSDGGDSGGPWFSGNTALGIHSGGTTDGQKAYYMAINYIDTLGLSVKTSP